MYRVLTRRLGPGGINAEFDVAPGYTQQRLYKGMGTFRGGSAIGVHFSILDSDFSGEPIFDRLTGLTERFWRFVGGEDSLVGRRWAESRCRSIARSTLPSARMRASKRDSVDAPVNIDDKIASLVSVSSSPSVPSFPIFVASSEW